MHEMLARLDGGEFLGLCGIMAGLVAILGGVSVAITKVVASHYRRTQLDEMEATLKMEMIQRGMAADEIRQVLEAKMSSRGTSWKEFFSAMPELQMKKGFGRQCERT